MVRILIRNDWWGSGLLWWMRCWGLWFAGAIVGACAKVVVDATLTSTMTILGSLRNTQVASQSHEWSTTQTYCWLARQWHNYLGRRLRMKLRSSLTEMESLIPVSASIKVWTHKKFRHWLIFKSRVTQFSTRLFCLCACVRMRVIVDLVPLLP